MSNGGGEGDKYNIVSLWSDVNSLFKVANEVYTTGDGTKMTMKAVKRQILHSLYVFYSSNRGRMKGAFGPDADTYLDRGIYHHYDLYDAYIRKYLSNFGEFLGKYQGILDREGIDYDMMMLKMIAFLWVSMDGEGDSQFYFLINYALEKSTFISKDVADAAGRVVEFMKTAAREPFTPVPRNPSSVPRSLVIFSGRKHNVTTETIRNMNDLASSNGLVTFKTIIACSLSRGIAEAFKGGGNDSMLLKIVLDVGLNPSLPSYFIDVQNENEEEIAVLPGAIMRVAGKHGDDEFTLKWDLDTQSADDKVDKLVLSSRAPSTPPWMGGRHELGVARVCARCKMLSN